MNPVAKISKIEYVERKLKAILEEATDYLKNKPVNEENLHYLKTNVFNKIHSYLKMAKYVKDKDYSFEIVIRDDDNQLIFIFNWLHLEDKSLGRLKLGD